MLYLIYKEVLEVEKNLSTKKKTKKQRTWIQKENAN